jgi:hypothetical protein
MEVVYTALINKPAIKEVKHFGSYRNFIGKSKQNEEKVLWKLSEVHWKMIHCGSYRNFNGKGRQNEEKVLWKLPELQWKRKAKRGKSTLAVTGNSLEKISRTMKKCFASSVCQNKYIKKD